MSREIKIDNHLDSNLRQLKIGEITAPIELATDKIRVSEKTTFAKDVVIEGDISIGGSTSDINLSDGVVLETTTTPGLLGVQALGIAIYATLYDGDGDYTDNDAKLSILASDGYDASISLYESSSIRWTVGNDADDSDKLKIDAGSITVGAATKLTLDSSGNMTTVGDVSIAATKKLYLDGGGDTYISENSADSVKLFVGGDEIFRVLEQGADGNQFYFYGASVGFNQLEPTYDATSTNVDFRLGNKQNLTFVGGSITNVNLYFPNMSGNFVLLLKQNGSGSNTVTNWKVYESDESSADGSPGVKWAGGSAPTLTTDANHVDIISFYWDADTEIAYGVATLDFQF